MKFGIVTLLIFWTTWLTAQTTGAIQGKVLDEQGRPLAGVAVYLLHTPYGTETNLQGRFYLSDIPSGNYSLVIELLGYQPDTLVLTVPPGKIVTLPAIRLIATPLQTNPVLVTATRHETFLSDVPISAAVIPASQIRLRSNLFLNQALQYIPGVSLNGGQVNIRGSTGYTRGVGSRVLLLVDGIPLLTGDTREINYDVLPIHLIQQVEVLKGAGSALYGSGAMGGVINVQTRPIATLPQFWTEHYIGFYSTPSYKEWQWNNKRQWLNGQLLGFKFEGQTVQTAVMLSRDEDQSYRANDWRKRWNVTLKTTIKPGGAHQLSFLVNGMQQHRANFLFWKNLKYALVPPDNQLGDEVQSRRGFMLGRYHYFFSPRTILEIKGSWFYNHFQDNIDIQTGGNRATSNEGRLEAQLTWQRQRHLTIVGASTNYSTVTSNIYGNRSLNEGSVFFQDEWKVLPWLTITGGLRGDGFALDTIAPQGNLSFRGAAMLKLSRAHRLRFSGGSGFRTPSLAEIFTTTNASGLTVVPNPALQPERNWAGEMGYRFLGKRWFVDVAMFYNRYANLIEPTFRTNLQIRFENVQQARIAGGEVLFNARWWHNKLESQVGYTYTDARDASNGQFLTFRPRHLVYFQLKGLLPVALVTLDYRYMSRYDRIDERLAVFVPDVDRYNAAHVLDISASTRLPLWQGHFTVNFTVKNVLNYYYTDLVGSLAPLRHVIFKVIWER